MWTRVQSLLNRRRVDRELDDEIDAHLEFAASEYAAQGLSPEAARQAALRDLGGVAYTKEAYREVRGFPALEALANDARYALRTLRKAPAFSAVAIVTLALGIGANGAIFGVADALLARPLSGIDAHGMAVVAIGQKAPAAAADYFDWKRMNTSFAQLAAYRQRDVNLTGIGAAERAYAADVTANFFAVLGVGPALGRAFTPDDEARNEAVAVLAHGYWQRRFGRDASVVGRVLDIDGVPYTIVGVMPPELEVPMPTDIWRPLILTPAEQSRRDILTLRVVGRLQPSSSVERAQAEFTAIARQLEADFPTTNRNRRAHVLALTEYVQGTITRSAVFLLLCCVGVVLAIACANIAGLQVARMTSRQRENNLRSALGASRWRVAQLALVENLVIAAISGVLGIVVASLCVSLLLHSMPPDIVRLIPGFARIQIDRRALLFILCVSLTSGVLSGVVPAIGSSRRRLNATVSRQRLRSLFVVAQISVALVMLVIGMLFVRSQRDLIRLHEVPEAARVVILNVNLPFARYPDEGSRSRFYEAALQQLAGLPSVQSAAVCTTVPLSNNGTTWARVEIEGRDSSPLAAASSVVTQSVSPDFFGVVGIPLREGRLFNHDDRGGSVRVAVVSEAMAQRYWPSGGAIGKRVRFNQRGGSDWLEIVGVAGNVLYDWTQRVPEAVVYRPVVQAPVAASTFAVRVTGDAATSVAALRQGLEHVDPLLPAFGVMSLADAIAESFAGTTQISAMMNMLAGLAFVIAVIGIYGIVAYTVAARTREFGVRMALGARRADIFRLVMRHALTLSAWGVCAGVAAAAAAMRVTQGLVFGAASATTATTIGIAILMAMTTVLACCAPARRATRADPVEALRVD
jgi:putative ABC transport system permease protein